LQVYFDVWRAILLLLCNSAQTGDAPFAREGPQGAFSSEIKKVTKINQKYTIFKNYFCNPVCSETHLEQCTILKKYMGTGTYLGGTVGVIAPNFELT